ncbi:MAG: T9SS type A sorting domain-containing protein [Bacteroidales bacterium]|nr:T9SS type A sorting domain-containing protein [Bacteroidales bacterium]
MKKFILNFVLIICFPAMIFSQQSLNTAGVDYQSSSGSVSIAVGQVFYSTNNSIDGTVSEGILQPYEIFVVTSIENQKMSLDCSVYPNPTTDLLILSFDNEDFLNHKAYLYNATGNIINIIDVKQNQSFISLENQPSGIYFLKITQNSNEVKTFKIIKN